MHKYLFFVFLFFALSACAQEKGVYIIKGRIDHYNEPAKIYLQYVENNEMQTLSSALKSGQFSFAGKIQEPVNGRLVLIPTGEAPRNYQTYPQTLDFFLDEGTTEINSPDVLQNAEISGSKINAEYQELSQALLLVHQQLNDLQEEYRQSSEQQNPDYLNGVQARYENLKAKEIDTYTAFVKNHPASYISLLIIDDLAKQPENIVLVDSLFGKLDAKIQNSGTGKKLGEKTRILRQTAVGVVAPDFAAHTPDNREVRLSDFRGKYVLVDFWASWCGPCRRENPNLVRNYQLYKDKNFDILGVSLDDQSQRTAWVQAIEKDRLTWTQVSDLGGWRSSIAQLYRITSIPQNVLLNPEGVIIAKNLRGQELADTLAEILK